MFLHWLWEADSFIFFCARGFFGVIITLGLLGPFFVSPDVLMAGRRSVQFLFSLSLFSSSLFCSPLFFSFRILDAGGP